MGTIVEILRSHAEQRGDRQVFDFVDRGSTSSSVTFAELDRRARSVAVWLLAGGAKSGDRTLLLYPPGLDYITAFLGSLYAGCVPVPCYPPSRSRSNNNIAHLDRIVKASGASRVITTAAIRELLPQIEAEAPALCNVPWISFEALATQDLSAQWRSPLKSGDDLAFLQYTSGSTGNPKGVMVTHANVVTNCRMMQENFSVTDTSRAVIWLPPYHDMGLIGGILTPLTAGTQCTLMSPVGFATNPFRWLEAISRTGAEFSGGPNFAYEFCVDSVKDEQLAQLDLSRWKTAFSGAEAVRFETLRRFTKKFAPCGFNPSAFYPCYGLAEGTLMVSGVKPGSGASTLWISEKKLAENLMVEMPADAEGARPVIDCGRTMRGQTIRIVDPERLTSCPDGSVGEVWVQGPSVARGYYGNPELTEASFHAKIPGENSGDFLRTGDLGFLRKGDLFITGRLKDLIIIRGRNFYPTDIESIAQEGSPELTAGCGAAFSVEIDGEERVVLVNEVDSRDKTLDAAVAAAKAIEAVAKQAELSIHEVVLVRARTIPKSTSGKIQRRATRTAYLEDRLEIAFRTRDGTSGVVPTRVLREQKSMASPKASGAKVREIESWITERLAKTLKRDVSEIPTTTGFTSMGLVSLDAIRMSSELGEHLGIELSPTLFYEHPDIESLARFLAGDEGRSRTSGRSLRSSASEPIAIIGMSCRFPKGEGTEEFWRTLDAGIDAIGDVPSDRWDVSAYYSATPGTPGKMIMRQGGFIKNADRFGAEFFGVLPLEARRIDPQQRLLMEVAAEALEDAGISFEKLAGSRTGTFVGISSTDYVLLQQRAGISPDLYSATGSAHSIAANRIAYWLDLRGPSIAIDTACSSSLVALHVASESLLRGESELAIAGGVNLILDPGLNVGFSQAGLLSPGARSRAFSNDADGFVRSEGAGAVILKRLSDAQRDGDRVLAVIRGSAVNQDGRTNGITAPNGLAQEEVIREALARAEISPDEISYLEAHGTGTKLGDPIEYHALARVFGSRSETARPLVVGSTKVNIGHLEAAAGIAGVIRTVLSLRKERIPKHLHLGSLNQMIAKPSAHLQIASEGSREWKRDARPRRAGVSSFGFGGTNAHLILEEAAEPFSTSAEYSRSPEVLVLSAPDRESLQKLVGEYARLSGPSLSDLARVTRSRRTRFAHSLALSVSTFEELKAKCEKVQLRTEEGYVAKLPASRRKLAYLFTGQGAQTEAMAQSLYETEIVFQRALNRCDEAYRKIRGSSLIELLYPGKIFSAKDPDTSLVQPALFSVEVALAEYWTSLGLRPDAVIGHSLGEIAAACVAGAMSLEDGMRLVCERGRLMQSTSPEGAMAVAFTAVETLKPYLERHGVELAAINGSELCTVSGIQSSLDALIADLKVAGIAAKRLAVARAFHSRLMEPILDEFLKVAKSIEFRPLRIPLVSNITAEVLPVGTLLDGEYWKRQLRSPTLFLPALQTLLAQDFGAFLEIGPLSVLRDMGKGAPKADRSSWLTSLHARTPARDQIAQTLGMLHGLGFSTDWRAWDGSNTVRAISVPFTPYLKKSYWFTERAADSVDARRNPMTSGSENIDELLNSLREKLSPLLGVSAPEIDVDLPLMEMGADSLLLLRAIQIIEDSYGVKLTVTQLFRDIPTIRALAEYIAQNGASSAASAPSMGLELPASTVMTTPQKGGIERIIQEQLKLLNQQLKLLNVSSGASSAAPVATPAPLPAPASMAASPRADKKPDRFAAFAPKSKVKEELDASKQKHLDALTARYIQKTPGSKKLAQDFRTHLSDCRAVAGFRPSVKEMVYPIVGVRSEGSRIWDVDQNEYIDFTMGFGVNLLGHNPAVLNDAIKKQLDTGFQIGPQSPLAGQVADLFCELTGLERVTFCNSGTEAMMTAARIVRATTQRDRLVIFEGSYHGTFDGFLGRPGAGNSTIPVAPGITRNLVGDLIILEYGTQQALEYIRANASTLAGVIVEPVQSRHPELQPGEFLREVRKITEAAGAALVFDETITGFRAAPGGAQEIFGIRADVATYGKILGGGLPIGAIGGSAKFMDCIDGGFWRFGDDSYPLTDMTFFAGTFSKHPLTMAASIAMLTHLKKEGKALQDGVAKKTERVANELNQFFEEGGYPLKIVHFRSFFRFDFPGNLDILFYHLMEKGIFIWEGRNCFISTAHSEKDLDTLIRLTKETVTELRQVGFIAPAPHAKGQEKIDPFGERFTELCLRGESYARAAEITVAFSLDGPVDVALLENAAQALQKRHESLQAKFDLKNSGWRLDSSAKTTFQKTSAKGLKSKEWIEVCVAKPLDPARAAFEIHVGSPEGTVTWICFRIHHIACDGFGAMVVLSDWLDLYSSLKSGKTVETRPLQDLRRIQQESAASLSEKHALDREYWKLELRGNSLPVLPGRKDGKPTGKAFEARTVLSAELTRSLKKSAQAARATLFQLLLSEFADSVQTGGKQDDLTIGIAYANRDLPQTEFLVANRVNLLPIRSQRSPSRVESVKAALSRGLVHGSYPWRQMQADQGAALFPVVFNFEPFTGMPKLPGVKISLLDVPAFGAELEWYVNVMAIGDELGFSIIADAGLFDHGKTEAWLKAFVGKLGAGMGG